MRVDRTIVDRGSFDHEIRNAAGGTKESKLVPQPPPHDCGVEIQHLLSLDDDSGSEQVVPGGQRFCTDHSSEPLQTLCDPARPLVDVGHDPRRAHALDRLNVPRRCAIGHFREAEVA
jgi:hypothetical protein